MSYEQRDNSGNLFRNDKGDNPKRPDYTGKALVNGVPMKISAWIKEGKTGKFMSLSFEEPKAERPRGKTPDAAPDFDDSLVPF